MINQGEYDDLQRKAKPEGIFFQPVTRQRDDVTEYGYTPHDYNLDTGDVSAHSIVTEKDGTPKFFTYDDALRFLGSQF